MSEAKKRKVHSPEFKAKLGLEALRGVKTLNEIGQEYGVHPVQVGQVGQVGQWKKEIQAQAGTLFSGKRGPKPVAERTGSPVRRGRATQDGPRLAQKKSGFSLP